MTDEQESKPYNLAVHEYLLSLGYEYSHNDGDDGWDQFDSFDEYLGSNERVLVGEDGVCSVLSPDYLHILDISRYEGECLLPPDYYGNNPHRLYYANKQDGGSDADR